MNFATENYYEIGYIFTGTALSAQTRLISS